MSTPKNWSSATPTATAAQSTIPPTTMVRSPARRTRSGTATARSAYSTSFRKLTRCSSKRASSSDTGRNVWKASHTMSAAPEIQSERAARETGDSYPGGRDCRSDENDDDGEIREPDVDRRRADPYTELGLVALVEEQERDRGQRAPALRARRDRRGCEGSTRSACCRTPRSSPRHYRAQSGRVRPPWDLTPTPTLTALCPPGCSDAGRRRLRGSMPLSPAASSGRSSPRGSSDATTSACSRRRSSSWASSRSCSTSRSRSR